MRVPSWTMVVAAALLSAACGQPLKGVADGAVEVDAGMPDAGTPVTAHFEAEAMPAGAAIWLKADLTALKSPRVEVWAQGVGPVLGIAFHLNVDAAQLKVESAGAEPVMGLDARYLQKVRGGDVAFGLAHLGVASGESDLTVPTRIAVLQLSTLGAVDSNLTLNRVLARKADGTFVRVTAAAGRLVLPGGAP